MFFERVVSRLQSWLPSATIARISIVVKPGRAGSHATSRLSEQSSPGAPADGRDIPKRSRATPPASHGTAVLLEFPAHDISLR